MMEQVDIHGAWWQYDNVAHRILIFNRNGAYTTNYHENDRHVEHTLCGEKVTYSALEPSRVTPLCEKCIQSLANLEIMDELAE